MINVGILGATGYVGIELVRILSQHPEVKLAVLVSKTYAGQKISEVYPNLNGIVDMPCEELNVDDIVQKCDIVFTALPHGASKELIPQLFQKGLKIIDLSGDYRYNNVEVYEKWYGQKHETPELLKESVYGLPELHRNEIKNKTLIGNPGCYTTCSIFGIAPLLANKLIDTKNIIIDAKSGVSGAGRGLGLDYHFCECTENIKAYKIATHRHTSEIEQELSLIAGEEIILSFTPHLIPMKRGILSTIYANLRAKHTTSELLEIYKEYYKNEFFIRIYDEGKLPETNHVAGSNFVDIGLVADERLNRVVVVSVLDNLIKGAAGQAVQNMNILFGLDEKTGLTAPGLYL